MASAVAHALVGGAIGILSALPAQRAGVTANDGETSRRLAGRFSRRLLWLSVALAVLPDADTLMHLVVPYSHPFGHRGALHSPAFYLLVSFALSQLKTFKEHRLRSFLALFLALLSHSLLDMMTDGGLGVAMFWPLSDTRYFFPYRPIPVSPLSVAAFFSERGLRILSAELPFAIPIFMLAWLSRRVSSRGAGTSPLSPAPETSRLNEQKPSDDSTDENPDDHTPEDGVAVLEIEEFIDLHSFAPRDILSVVESYLEAAHERGFAEVRLIHGRGKGVQRARIRKLLAAHSLVLNFKDAPQTRGGWGATLVWLKQENPAQD